MATAGPWQKLPTKLDPALTHVLTSHLSHPTMTPVQAAAIPPLLTSKDVCVQAETGSGKTLSFLVPIAQKMLFSSSKRPRTHVWAIVLLPTRELARQVHTVACRLFERLPGDVVPVPLIGGAEASAAPAQEYARDHRLVVATPGRLSAAVASNAINYSQLEVLILDEADRLLDMGFSVTLTDILTRLPRQRRTGIYSATQTAELEALARAGMRNPVRVVVKVHAKGGGGCEAEKRRRIPTSLRCYYAVVPQARKLAHMMTLLAKRPNDKFILYMMTCACVDYYRRLPLADMLNAALAQLGNDEKEHESTTRQFLALHGKMSQKRRERSLATFTECKNGILLCTDVAARGIDIPDVDWVVQFDPPQDPDAYIHRVGRTARLGREGNALIYIAPSEDAYVDFLQVRKCPVEILPSLSRSNAVCDDGVSEEAATAVQQAIRAATLADRALLEASEAAFLSFIRAYKEHKCRYLLKLEEVDINSVADSFGLFRLPRFHEFKKLRAKIQPRGQGVVIRDIKFKDKKREAQRQEQIREAVENRAERREALAAKSKKRKRKKKNKDNGTHIGIVTNKQGAIESIEDDEEDFCEEARQLRKVKRGKLSHEEFDTLHGYDETAV